MIKHSHLYEVPVAKLTQEKLEKYLASLPEQSKVAMGFVYSEVLLRAKRNSSYQKILSDMLNICDGKGLRWAIWLVQDDVTKQLKHFYTKSKLFLPLYYLVVAITFPVYIVYSILSLFLILLKYDFAKLEIENILGRKYTYNILEIAQQQGWNTLVIGGSSTLEKNLASKFPALKPKFWYKPSDSHLMRDIPIDLLDEQKGKYLVDLSLEQKHKLLSTENYLSYFPDLNVCLEWVGEQEKSSSIDLVLVTIGGASGKQEFLVDSIKKDFSPRLVVCIGAALDHLGAGAKQTEAPKLWQAVGLEWLHRFIYQPYRRSRIWDSVFTLWWWSVCEVFPKKTK